MSQEITVVDEWFLEASTLKTNLSRNLFRFDLSVAINVIIIKNDDWLSFAYICIKRLSVLFWKQLIPAIHNGFVFFVWLISQWQYIWL